MEFLNATVDPLKKTYQEDQMRNFVDFYIQEINANAKPDGKFSFKVKKLCPYQSITGKF